MNTGNSISAHVLSSPGATPSAFSRTAEFLAQQIVAFRRRHPLLELGPLQNLRRHRILVEENLLVKPRIGHANHAVLAQLRIVAKQRHLANRPLVGLAQAVVPVVIADRIRHRDVRRVRRLEKRNQPRPMLIGNRDRPRARHHQRNPLLDHRLHRLIHAPQVRAAKRRKSSLEIPRPDPCIPSPAFRSLPCPSARP